MQSSVDASPRTAVVTGACGKLGPIWVSALLEAGWNVVGVELPGVAASPPIADLQGRYGDALSLLEADVTDRASLDACAAAVRDRYGSVAALVNNAGIDQPPGTPSKSHRLEDIPVDVARGVVEVNLVGLFQATQAFLPLLRAAGAEGSAIVNIGSIYGRLSPDPRLYDHIPVDPPFLKPPMYGASKAGVESLTRYLAAHLAGDGIRVNCLVPGGVLGQQDESFKEKFCAKVPLGRMATAADLTGPLVFLAGAASSYVTGQSLVVDGGLEIW